MDTVSILNDLKSRGEKNISFDRLEETGCIISLHGKSTVNYWQVINNELICVDCKTIYKHSF